MGQSKSKPNIKYAKLPCPSKNVDSEDEIDVEIGNLKKSDEKSEVGNLKKNDEKSETPKPFTKAWLIGVGFATISGKVSKLLPELIFYSLDSKTYKRNYDSCIFTNSLTDQLGI